MQWELLTHSVTEPSWAWGLVMVARRAGEAAMPPLKRFAIAFGPIVLSAALSAAGAVFGTMQAFSAEISKLHEKDIRLEASISERTTLRESQMTQFRMMCSEVQSRVAVVESRQRDAELLAAELRALVRHETNEIESRRRAK